MLARLILVLLMAVSALPASASACHVSTAPHQAMRGMADMSDHAMPDRAANAHACVGCIPPPDWSGQSVTAPELAPEAVSSHAIVRFDVGLAAQPVLPPPKRG